MRSGGIYRVQHIAAHLHQKAMEGARVLLHDLDKVASLGGFDLQPADGALHVVVVRTLPHHHNVLAGYPPFALCVFG